MSIRVIAIVALALASCQQSPETNVAQAPGVSDPVSNYTARVVSLPDGQREMVFLRAIRDAGLDCQAITKADRIEDVGGKPTWRAQCSDGTAHLLQVAPDGTALIASRIPA